MKTQRRFLAWVDSESFRLFQAVMYSVFCVAGAYMLTFDRSPSAVQNAMGTSFNVLWTLLLFICPILVVVGYRMTDQYTGLCLQLGADGCVTLCLIAYASSLVNNGALSNGSFALFLTAGLIGCTSLITLRDGRRLALVNAVAKELTRREHDR